MKDRLDKFESKLVELTKEFTALWKDVHVPGHDDASFKAPRSHHNQEAADEIAAGVAEGLRCARDRAEEMKVRFGANKHASAPRAWKKAEPLTPRDAGYAAGRLHRQQIAAVEQALAVEKASADKLQSGVDEMIADSVQRHVTINRLKSALADEQQARVEQQELVGALTTRLEGVEEAASGTAAELRNAVRGVRAQTAKLTKVEIVAANLRTLVEDYARQIVQLEKAFAGASRKCAEVKKELAKAESKLEASWEINTAQAEQIKTMKRGLELAAESIFGS
jgi:hypothetical protein